MKTKRQSKGTMALGVTVATILLVIISLLVILINRTTTDESNVFTTQDTQQDIIEDTIRVSECKFEYVVVACGDCSYSNIIQKETFLVEHIQENEYITSKEAVTHTKFNHAERFSCCEFVPEQSSQCIRGE